MSVRLREGEGQNEQAQFDVQRRTLGQKECAEKIAQSLVFGLLIFAGAMALPTTLAHLALGYMALKQFYVVAYWAGLQRRLRRGEFIEIVTTPGVTRGYVPSFSVAMLATMVAVVCTFVTLLVYLFSPAPRGDEVTYLAFASLGLCWTAWRLWHKAVSSPVTRAIIRPSSDAQAAGYATRDSDPLAFDLEGASQAAPTASHPVSQRKHWWTDTQLREENKPPTER